MTVRAALLPAAVWLAGMAVPASAGDTPQCVANGERFAVGQYACLTAGGQSHLARCETDLEMPTWARMLDTCPGGAPASAAPSFQCRANGQLFPAGGFACLTISGRRQLARCDAVLNNSSWTAVREGCPGGPLPEAASTPDNGSALKDALALPKRLFDRLMDQM
jgi:hypothetical protein